MTLDSSALIAILCAEPGYLDLVDRILDADHVRIGAPTLVEARMVFSGRRAVEVGKRSSTGEIDALVRELAITVVPFGEAEWHLAVAAFGTFGRGRHRAALNFGDCLAYATARSLGDTLLFVGDDFSHTDIVSA